MHPQPLMPYFNITDGFEMCHPPKIKPGRRGVLYRVKYGSESPRQPREKKRNGIDSLPRRARTFGKWCIPLSQIFHAVSPGGGENIPTLGIRVKVGYGIGE